MRKYFLSPSANTLRSVVAPGEVHISNLNIVCKQINSHSEIHWRKKNTESEKLVNLNIHHSSQSIKSRWSRWQSNRQSWILIEIIYFFHSTLHSSTADGWARVRLHSSKWKGKNIFFSSSACLRSDNCWRPMPQTGFFICLFRWLSQQPIINRRLPHDRLDDRWMRWKTLSSAVVRSPLFVVRSRYYSP